MARYIARFMKDVLGENGYETEICQRSLEIEAANKARAADAAKIKFCEAESVKDWSLHADRVQITELQIKSHPIISKLIDAFGNWRKHRQEIREIRDLYDDEFANLAHELRISPADLDTFVRQGPHAVDELPKLLTALGIDEKALSRTQPLVLRDMVVSAPHANKSISVTATSTPVPPPSTMRSIASMRRQSTRWTRKRADQVFAPDQL
jgi:uncharacterized protein YjiS (DUF1127 family)